MYPELVKVRLITLKILLKLRYQYIYLVFGLVLYILSTNSYLYFIPSILFLIFMYKYRKSLLLIVILICGIYQSSILLFHSKSLEIQEDYEITVIDGIKDNYTTSFRGKIDGLYIKVSLPEITSIKPGDILVVTGELTLPRSNTIPKGFNYKNYLYSKNMKYIIQVDNYSKLGSKLTIQRIPHIISKYIDSNFPKSKAYIKTFILADKSEFDQSFINSINDLGISHLFAVSGLHITLLVLTLEKFIKTKRRFIITVFLVIYIVLTAFSPSVVRASLLYILIQIVKKYKLKLSNLDVLSIIFIGYLVISPYMYYNMGFVLSFTVTFSILLTPYLFKSKNVINSLFTVSLVAFLTTIPIVLSLNYQLNIYSLIINVVMILYMSYVILPFGYITFFLPFLDDIYARIIKPFEFIVHTQSQLEFLTFKFTFTNNLNVILYYVFLFLILINVKTKKCSYYIQMLSLLILFTYYSNILSPTKEISVIDVYGDSILVKDSHDRCNILIDTGVTDQYDSVIDYIKSKNIRRLDYVIITHYHDDHMGELDDILESFNIGQIIDYDNHPNHIECGSLDLEFYELINESFEENNKSVVFKLYIEDDTYLFTGDIEKEREKELLENFRIHSSNLKAGHHGSITSSSAEFIDTVDPNEVFITSFHKNTHNHPSVEVINRYKDRNITISRIDLDGTIIISYLFGVKDKKTTPP